MFLQDEYWLRCAEDLNFELLHCEEEGRCIPPELRQKADEIRAMVPGEEREKSAMQLYCQLEALPIANTFPYREPSEWEEMCTEFPSAVPPPACGASEAELYNRIYGGWLGRAAGCLLGKPVEGWKRARIVGLLEDTDNYPAKGYMRSDIADDIRERYQMRTHNGQGQPLPWGNQVAYMPEDDDTNYTVLSLKTVKTYGRDFTREQMAESWLNNLPILHTCTAERVAYRNFVQLIGPPRSATWLNPYREWIGAQIRVDFYGYINPGDPDTAARMAWTDASISHVKNGIYGATYIAAMIAGAFVCQEPRKIIEIGLSKVPVNSRLAREIHDVLRWYDTGKSGMETRETILQRYTEGNPHHWTHTLSNAMIVTAALLYGEMDLGKTIAYALEAGFDTDCNCATSGSIVGTAVGAGALPQSWITPLCDTLLSGVDGYHHNSISNLAMETCKCLPRPASN